MSESKTFCYEDNKGADFIIIIPRENNRFEIQIARSSVYIFTKAGTISEIVKALDDKLSVGGRYG